MPKYKVYGKSHQEGTSKKTGRPYCFNTIHTLSGAYGVEGFCAKQINLDSNRFPFDSIQVGSVVQIDFDDRGFVVDLIVVPASKSQ